MIKNMLKQTTHTVECAIKITSTIEMSIKRIIPKGMLTSPLASTAARSMRIR